MIERLEKRKKALLGFYGDTVPGELRKSVDFKRFSKLSTSQQEDERARRRRDTLATLKEERDALLKTVVVAPLLRVPAFDVHADMSCDSLHVVLLGPVK